MTTSDDVSKISNQEVLKFGEKVFSYSLQKFGIIYKENAHSSLFTEEIGNAVVILQLHIRDFLRDHLSRGIDKMVGVIDSNQKLQAIQQLLYLRHDETLEDYSIHTVLLGYLALITELFIFMESADLPVQMDWYTKIWIFIYDTRLKQKFQGRWKDLKAEAEKVCNECPQKEELFEELKYLEHPYAEIDPRIETSFKELDPFYIFCTLGTGFEFPRKAGLSQEALEGMLKSMNIDDNVIEL